MELENNETINKNKVLDTEQYETENAGTINALYIEIEKLLKTFEFTKEVKRLWTIYLPLLEELLPSIQ